MNDHTNARGWHWLKYGIRTPGWYGYWGKATGYSLQLLYDEAGSLVEANCHRLGRYTVSLPIDTAPEGLDAQQAWAEQLWELER